MKTVIEYLDDLKDITGSDYKSAKMLNIEKSSISMIRSRGKMSDETAVKMADLLGIERDEVLIAAAIARSTGEVKSSWEKIGKKSGIAVGLMLVATLSYGLFSIGFDEVLEGVVSADNIHYAKLGILVILGVVTMLLAFNKWKSYYGKKENKFLSHPE